MSARRISQESRSYITAAAVAKESCGPSIARLAAALSLAADETRGCSRRRARELVFSVFRKITSNDYDDDETLRPPSSFTTHTHTQANGRALINNLMQPRGADEPPPMSGSIQGNLKARVSGLRATASVRMASQVWRSARTTFSFRT